MHVRTCILRQTAARGTVPDLLLSNRTVPGSDPRRRDAEAVAAVDERRTDDHRPRRERRVTDGRLGLRLPVEVAPEELRKPTLRVRHLSGTSLQG